MSFLLDLQTLDHNQDHQRHDLLASTFSLSACISTVSAAAC